MRRYAAFIADVLVYFTAVALLKYARVPGIYCRGGGGGGVPLIECVVDLHLPYPYFLHARKTMLVIFIPLFSEMCEIIQCFPRSSKDRFLVSLLAPKKGFPRFLRSKIKDRLFSTGSKHCVLFSAGERQNDHLFSAH